MMRDLLTAPLAQSSARGRIDFCDITHVIVLARLPFVEIGACVRRPSIAKRF